ncbi:hypothetical protein KA977_06815 [Candidatus Dependentiae bacterium]|nr:hypothetical protein [Candidatus Dependentiae bacterium]
MKIYNRFFIIITFLILTIHTLYAESAPPPDTQTVFNNLIIENVIKKTAQDLKNSLNQLLADKIIDVNQINGKILYAYSLAKIEDYQKYAEQLILLQSNIKRMSEQNLNNLEKFLEKFREYAEKDNPVVGAMFDQLTENINLRKKVFRPQTQSISSVDYKVSIFINWFNHNENEAPLVNKLGLRDYLKNELEKSFKNSSSSYDVNLNGQFKLEGLIKNFQLVDNRVNSSNQVLEKRYELLVDFKIVSSQDGKIITEKKNFYTEYLYYTPVYSVEIGISDKQALDEFVIESANKIHDEADKIFKDIREQLKTGKKIIELSSEQKSLINSMSAKPAQPLKKISAVVSLSNEDIQVKGDIESSGELIEHNNKVSADAEFKVNLKDKTGIFAGLLKLKGSNYDEREYDLDKITAEYKTKSLVITAGNIFPMFTKMTFNNSQEGIMIDYKIPGNKEVLKFFAGRDRRPEDFQNFERLNLGLNLNIAIDKKSSGIFSFVYSEDDRNSIVYDSNVFIPGKNTLISFSGKILPFSKLTVQYEFIYSYFTDLSVNTESIIGNAIEIKTNYAPNNNNNCMLNYIRIDPDYVTMNGIATIDRQKFDFTYINKSVKDLNIKFSTIYQNDNLDEYFDKTNYLNSYTSNLTYLPFTKNDIKPLNKIKIENTSELRKTYNELLSGNSKRDKYNENLLFNFKISNTLLSNALNLYVSYERENEDDKVNFTISKSRQYEYYNSYTKKIFNILNIDLRGKYRYKTIDEKKDKFINGSCSLKYSKNSVSSSISYYYDLNKTSVIDQDSKKQKLEYEFIFLQKLPKIKNNYTLKIVYDINDFENSDMNYKKLSAFTGIKMEF